MSRWDFIIVGGGSAGCCLGNRLSADPDRSVLVLEAGRPDSWWDVFIHMPAALTIPEGMMRAGLNILLDATRDATVGRTTHKLAGE